jgi:hypothetical protein
MKGNFKPKLMKNTVKLFVAAFVVALAASCGSKNESTGETKDTVTVQTPVTADTTSTSADTTATSADTTATAH